MTARATLKSLFETGDPLNQTAFTTLIDGLAITEEDAAKVTKPTTVESITTEVIIGYVEISLSSGGVIKLAVLG